MDNSGKTLKIFQVDAFTDKVFGGNPAAVCPLEEWLDEGLMQKIAAENNLSETAFFVKRGEGYTIRWFTPVTEVALCGHATLASAHVLFRHLGHKKDTIHFYSLHSGPLPVSRNGKILTLDFPADEYRKAAAPQEILQALDTLPRECYKGNTDFMLVYDNEEEILACSPDMGLLRRSDVRGVIITAPGKEVDFVSRFFAPGSGVDEDPVTGSAHTTLTPYWSRRLGKVKLTARQLSKRGGDLLCEFAAERVRISGKAVTYLTGEILIPDVISDR